MAELQTKLSGDFRTSPKRVRESCVNELCIVMHGDANQSDGRPGISLKYKASGDPTRD